MANIYDVIIVGSGPAGISAGIYASRKKLNTLIITKDFVGQIGKASAIFNYPGFEEIEGLELAKRFRAQAEKLGIQIKEGEAAKEIIKNKEGLFEIRTGSKQIYLSKTVIITSGRDPRPLEVPGEKEFIGKGVSYCVTCDGPLFRGKTVAVVGGGNSGFKTAFELATICPKVYIFEFGMKPKADEMEQERVGAQKNVEVIANAEVKEIKGKSFVEKIIYQDRLSKKISEVGVQGIFVEVGYIPVTVFTKNLVDLNESDEIIVDKNCKTKTPGLFAAGDITDVAYKQIIIAAGDGAKAGLSAYEYIQSIKEN